MEKFKREMILNILNEYYSLECEMVGESNLDNIISGYNNKIQTLEGDDFGFSDALATLIAVKDYISLLFEYLKLNREKKVESSYEDFSNRPITIIIDNSVNIYNKSEEIISKATDNEIK